MNRVERNQAAQPVLLGTRVEGADGGASQVGDPIAAGSGRVNIPWHVVFEGTLAGDGIVNTFRRMVPEGTLETRSVVAIAAPQNPSASLLWITPEGIGNMTKDELIESFLLFQRRGDPTKLAMLLSLPDGQRIAEQIVERIPGYRLLELFGGNEISANSFVDCVLSGTFLESLMPETPTIKEMKDRARVECELFPEDLQNAETDGRLTSLALAMRKVYIDKDRREEFEGKLEYVVDLIFAKFPPPNEGNRAYWNNIGEAVRFGVLDEVGENVEDAEAKFAELRERFPALNLVFPRD